MIKYILVSIVSLIIGFFLAKIIKMINIDKYNEEVSDVLIKSMELENEYAKRIGEKSMIDYTIETKGLDFAIYYYGSIYKILLSLKKKDDHIKKIEDSLGLFLKEALKQEIDEYKNQQLSNDQKRTTKKT